MNQSGGATCEVEWAGIRQRIVFEFLFDLPDLADDQPGAVSEVHGSRCRHQPLAGFYEELGTKFGSQVVQVHTHAAHGDIHLLCGTGETGVVDYCEEKFQLAEIHMDSPESYTVVEESVFSLVPKRGLEPPRSCPH